MKAETTQFNIQRGVQIGIESLVLSKNNPRQSLVAQDDAELKASIQQKGILVPLAVVPRNEKFEVIDGSRRLCAFLSLHSGKNDKTPFFVPCDVYPAETTEADIQTLRLVLNIQRSSPHPLDEAKALADHQKQCGWTLPQLAQVLGKTTKDVAAVLALNNLSPLVVKAYRDKKMDFGQAAVFARYSQNVQDAVYKDSVSKDESKGHLPLSTAALSEKFLQRIHLPLSKALFNLDDAELVKECGSCAVCPKRSINKPDLFSAKNDECTDPGCYNIKTEAWLIKRKKELEEETGEKVVFISTMYQGGKIQNDTILSSDKWRHASHVKPKKVSKGIVAKTWENQGHKKEIGKVIDVCLEGDYTTGGSRTSKPVLSEKEQKKRKDELFEQRQRKAHIHRLLKFLLEGGNPDRDAVWKAILEEQLEELSFDESKLINDVFGLEAPKCNGHNGREHRKTADDKLKLLSKDPLGTRRVVMALYFIKFGLYSTNIEQLKVVSKAAGGDVAKLLKEATLERQVSKPSKKKAVKASKTKKPAKKK